MTPGPTTPRPVTPSPNTPASPVTPPAAASPGGLAQAPLWLVVGLLYGLGVLAAAQLGKLSALAPLLAPALGLSLPTMAAAISLLEVSGALLGAVAGLLAWRVGLQRSLRWGLACLALGGLGLAAAQGAASLLAWRALESLGYLAVTLTAPVLLAQAAARAGPQAQGSAMALWSSFVPVGLALGALAAGGLADPLGWRGVLLGNGLLATAVAVAVWRWRALRPPKPAAGRDATDLSRDPQQMGQPVTDPTPAQAEAQASDQARAQAQAKAESHAQAGPRVSVAAWCLSLGFGCFALVAVGELALLPTLLVTQGGVSPARAAQIASAASLANVLGSAVAAWLLRQGLPLRWPLVLSLALPAALFPWVLVSEPEPWRVGGLAVLQNIGLGVFASLAFARLPVVAGGADRMVRANGVLTQCGAGGAWLGPPVMAACVGWGGWPAAAWCGVLLAAAGLPLLWRAGRD